MTREEEIKQAAEETLRREGYHAAVHEFMDGAEWADAHPINPWHKVSEELPDENSTVLGVGISGYPYICRYMYGHWFSENNLTERITITHWMEIPEIKED